MAQKMKEEIVEMKKNREVEKKEKEPQDSVKVKLIKMLKLNIIQIRM